MRNELINYVRRNPKIRMMYLDGKGRITMRTVRVLTINNTYFTAFCYLRGKKRTFTIDHVLAVVSAKVKRAVV